MMIVSRSHATGWPVLNFDAWVDKSRLAKQAKKSLKETIVANRAAHKQAWKAELVKLCADGAAPSTESTGLPAGISSITTIESAGRAMRSVLAKNHQGHNFPITFFEMVRECLKFHNQHHGGLNGADLDAYEQHVAAVFEVSFKGCDSQNGQFMLFCERFSLEPKDPSFPLLCNPHLVEDPNGNPSQRGH